MLPILPGISDSQSDYIAAAYVDVSKTILNQKSNIGESDSFRDIANRRSTLQPRVCHNHCLAGINSLLQRTCCLVVDCVGPLEHTCTDFWTMIWAEDIPTIVMLTHLTEGMKVFDCLAPFSISIVIVIFN